MLRFFVIFLTLAIVVSSIACCTPSPPGTKLESSKFIPLLRQVSEPFDGFYGNEIEPLHVKINWFYNPNLGTPATTDPSPDYKTYTITLLHIPSADEGNASLNLDAFIIAHELATLIVGPTFSQGWEIHCSNEDNVPLVRIAMFDMISTPLRNHILAKYHFDVLGDFQSHRDYWVHNSECTPLAYPLEKDYVAFYYVYFALYWEYVLGNSSFPPDFDWFQKCAPDAPQEGLNIISMVDEIGGLGNITADKAEALFKRIIAIDPSLALNFQIVETK